MKKILLFLIAFMFLAISAYSDSYIDGVPVIDQDDIIAIFRSEGMNFTGICGPTVTAEAIGFWLSKYPNLADVVLSGNVPDNSEGMQDLLLLAMSYTGYVSGEKNWPEDVAAGIRQWFADAGYAVEVDHRGKNKFTLSEVLSELDSGRPVLVAVEPWNHWVLAIGYRQLPELVMTFLYGHDPLERDLTGLNLPPLSGTEVVFVRPQGAVDPPADPTLESWWPEVSAWMQEHGYELEPVD